MLFGDLDVVEEQPALKAVALARNDLKFVSRGVRIMET